jgi:hypothetical protein
MLCVPIDDLLLYVLGPGFLLMLYKSSRVLDPKVTFPADRPPVPRDTGWRPMLDCDWYFPGPGSRSLSAPEPIGLWMLVPNPHAAGLRRVLRGCFPMADGSELAFGAGVSLLRYRSSRLLDPNLAIFDDGLDEITCLPTLDTIEYAPGPGDDRCPNGTGFGRCKSVPNPNAGAVRCLSVGCFPNEPSWVYLSAAGVLLLPYLMSRRAEPNDTCPADFFVDDICRPIAVLLSYTAGPGESPAVCLA